MSIYGSAMMTQGHMSYAAASLDVAGIGVILTALFGYLPPVAALLAIMWYVLQIWESKTVQGWRGRCRARKAVRRLLKDKSDYERNGIL